MVNELIIMPNWLGDCMIALSVIHRKISMQHTNLFLLINPALVDICSALYDVPVIPFKRNNFSEYKMTLKIIKEKKFDAVYILPPSFSSVFFSFLCGIKKRRGISCDFRTLLLTQPLPASLRKRTNHMVYEYSIVLETDFVPPEYWQGIKLPKHENYVGSIVFCPGAKYGPAKQWKGFVELANLLNGKEIVLLGDELDCDIAEEIESSCEGPIINLVGKTSLIQAAQIISHAKIVVSNDSGLMHVAGYTGTPVVGIFGSTSPLWTRPLGNKVKIAQVKTNCSPCFKRLCRYKDYHCLNNISAQEVLSLMEQLVGHI